MKKKNIKGLTSIGCNIYKITNNIKLVSHFVDRSIDGDDWYNRIFGSRDNYYRYRPSSFGAHHVHAFALSRLSSITTDMSRSIRATRTLNDENKHGVGMTEWVVCVKNGNIRRGEKI